MAKSRVPIEAGPAVVAPFDAVGGEAVPIRGHDHRSEGPGAAGEACGGDRRPVGATSSPSARRDWCEVELAETTARELVALKRAGAPGLDRVLGVGYDSIEIGQEPGWYAEAFRIAGAGGFRRTAHQGENSGPDAILACVDLLGAERIDHGLSILDDPDVVARFVDEQIALTVCPNSNIRIANAFPELAQHVYPAVREAGLLATLNTDDPALTDLDLGYEYASVAEAFGYGWDQMVDVALDGVRACWLDDDDRAGVRAPVEAARGTLRPEPVPGVSPGGSGRRR